MTCERRVWQLLCGHQEEMDLKCSFQADPNHTHTTIVVNSDSGKPSCPFCNPPAAPTEQQWHDLPQALAFRQLPPPGSLTSVVRGFDGDVVAGLDQLLDRGRIRPSADTAFQNQIHDNDHGDSDVLTRYENGGTLSDAHFSDQYRNVNSQIEASRPSSGGAAQQPVGQRVNMVNRRTVPRRRHGGRQD
ncbi:MAG: hypothetical protein Q9186_003131 [Xanthomendoza sp. 1 TL-2023]